MAGYDHKDSPYFVLDLMKDEARVRARTRALNLHRRAVEAGDAKGNPTTALWKLVDVLLLGSSQKARKIAEVDGSSSWWTNEDPGNDDS